MQSLFNLINLLINWGSFITLAFIICLSLPKSELRRIVLPIASWCFAILCGAYVFSPVDFVPEALLGPFGLVDDIAAGVMAITAIKTAQKEQHP